MDFNCKPIEKHFLAKMFPEQTTFPQVGNILFQHTTYT